jgi:DNA mismatch repair protein MutS
MTQNLTILYRKFYETYSKKYGTNTCILLLVGKFYEVYDLIDPESGNPYTSAKRAVEIMNIALKEKPEYGPNKETGLWSGFPEQSLHKFAAPLTSLGWTVVVVDQVKDSISDQVIDRIPTRILSPGTHFETASQERMSVSAIWIHDSIYAAAVLDITTGEVFSFQTKDFYDIQHMLQVYCVKESVLTIAESGPESSGASLSQSHQSIQSIASIPGLVHKIPFNTKDNFAASFPREEYLRKMFRVKSLLPTRTVLRLSQSPEQTERALCLLLRFVEDHFPQHIERLASHEPYIPDNHMRLSNNILEQLSIITTNGQKSVLNLLHNTHSAIGRRAMRERILRPITNTEELEKRCEQVSFLVNPENTDTRKASEQDVKALYDLPRLHYKFSEASTKSLDVLQCAQTYSATTCLIQNLKQTPLACPESLEQQIVDFRRQFRTLFDEEKAQQREDGRLVGYLTPISGPQTYKLEMKIQEIQETWLKTWTSFCKSIKIPPESFHLEQKGDGEFVWEGPRSFLKSIQGAAFSLGQSSQNGQSNPVLTGLQIDFKKSGPITLGCKELYVFCDSLRSSLRDLNNVLARELVPACDTLWETVRPFQNEWFEWLGMVDCSAALASAAKQYGWCRPSFCSDSGLDIKGLRHPLLETAETRLEYVKHDVALGKGTGKDHNGWLIYGVNASGKSSLMKAVGISVILAQAGSFVPADSMRISPYDAAFSRIWTQDNLWAGLSSFAVEISELRDILLQATDKSLVLGDEVCSGTESMSATALVASTLEHLDSKGSHFIFATHLHDLMKVPRLFPRPGIAVWHLQVQRTPEGKLIYDRTLQPGSGSCTYGLEVARAMGIPFELLERAHEIRRALGGEAAVTNAPKSVWNPAIQRHKCEVCGAAVVKDLEVHHIIPRSEGGLNALRNLVVLCETCHDKHHAGEIEVGELKQTSEGFERSSVMVSAVESRKSVKARVSPWSEEQLTSIRAALEKYKGRPLTRTTLALQEEGITISPAQLRRI